MTSLDEKNSDISDTTIIKVQSQSTLFTTTYGTLKQIPYLNSLYLRWHDRNIPLEVDARASFIEEILAEHSIITREFLGLESKASTFCESTSTPETKKRIREVTLITDYGLEYDLVITIAKEYRAITFMYHGTMQKWRQVTKGSNVYKRLECTRVFNSFQKEDLAKAFKEILAEKSKKI